MMHDDEIHRVALFRFFLFTEKLLQSEFQLMTSPSLRYHLCVSVKLPRNLPTVMQFANIQRVYTGM